MSFVVILLLFFAAVSATLYSPNLELAPTLDLLTTNIPDQNNSDNNVWWNLPATIDSSDTFLVFELPKTQDTKRPLLRDSSGNPYYFLNSENQYEFTLHATLKRTDFPTTLFEILTIDLCSNSTHVYHCEESSIECSLPEDSDWYSFTLVSKVSSRPNIPSYWKPYEFHYFINGTYCDTLFLSNIMTSNLIQATVSTFGSIKIGAIQLSDNSSVLDLSGPVPAVLPQDSLIVYSPPVSKDLNANLNSTVTHISFLVSDVLDGLTRAQSNQLKVNSNLFISSSTLEMLGVIVDDVEITRSSTVSLSTNSQITVYCKTKSYFLQTLAVSGSIENSPIKTATISVSYIPDISLVVSIPYTTQFNLSALPPFFLPPSADPSDYEFILNSSKCDATSVSASVQPLFPQTYTSYDWTAGVINFKHGKNSNETFENGAIQQCSYLLLAKRQSEQIIRIDLRIKMHLFDPFKYSPVNPIHIAVQSNGLIPMFAPRQVWNPVVEVYSSDSNGGFFLMSSSSLEEKLTVPQTAAQPFLHSLPSQGQFLNGLRKEVVVDTTNVLPSAYYISPEGSPDTILVSFVDVSTNSVLSPIFQYFLAPIPLLNYTTPSKSEEQGDYSLPYPLDRTISTSGIAPASLQIMVPYFQNILWYYPGLDMDPLTNLSKVPNPQTPLSHYSSFNESQYFSYDEFMTKILPHTYMVNGEAYPAFSMNIIGRYNSTFENTQLSYLMVGILQPPLFFGVSEISTVFLDKIIIIVVSIGAFFILIFVACCARKIWIKRKELQTEKLRKKHNEFFAKQVRALQLMSVNGTEAEAGMKDSQIESSRISPPTK